MGLARIAAALAIVLAPAAARAQPYYVRHATLYVDGAQVGTMASRHVEMTSWPMPEHPIVHMEDGAAVIDAMIDLGRAEVTVDVPAETRLVAPRPWRVDLLAATRVVVRGRNGERLRIQPPRGFPLRRLWMPIAAIAPRASPPSPPRERMQPDWSSWSIPCGAPEARAARDPAAPRFRLRGVAIRGAGGTRVDVWDRGFVIHAWMDRAPGMCDGGFEAPGLGGGCTTGRPAGEPVVIPAGTELYVRETSRDPFARATSDLVGFPVGDIPGRFRVSHTDGEGHGWSIEGWVRNARSFTTAAPAGASREWRVCNP
jgi:hypothetical protein